MTTNARLSEAIGMSVSVGIDVSKASLEVCVMTKDGRFVNTRLANTRQAITAFVESLLTTGFHGPIVVESTGHYHWLIAVCAAEAGLDMRLINPLMSSKHSRAAIRKTKTDPVDARQLAVMGVTEPNLPAPWKHDAAWVAFRHRVGLLCTLEKTLQQTRASLNTHRQALAMVGVESDAILEALAVKVHELACECARAEKMLTRELASRADDGLNERLCSIPGISAYLAGLLELFLRTDVPGPKSWSAFIGLDISVKQSGTWQGRSRLTKRGNAYLRKRIYQGAWGAMQSNAEFRAYYDRLRAQGRGYVESLLIIARKLLRIAYALWTKGGTYNSAMMKA